MPRLSVRLLLVWLLLAPAAFAADYALITKEEVASSLTAGRAAWEAKIRTTSPRLYFSSAQWPRVAAELEAIPASRAGLGAKFAEAVDRILAEPPPVYQPPEKMVGTRGDAKTLYSAQEELWQREVGNQIFALAVAARLYPEKPYRAKMREIVLAALGFDTWGRTSSRMGNNADLAAGHIARGIAVAYDWHRDAFSPAEQKRIRDTVAGRLPNLLRGLYGDAFWARGYEDNHNHVSAAALGFCGIAFYDEIPDAPEWLAAARLNFQTVARHFPSDGSSREGVSYWTYGMAYILQFIEASRLITDSAELYRLPFLQNAASYRLHASTSGLAGNIIWGDSVPRDWSTPHFILYRLASEYRDSDAAWFADHLPAPRGGSDELALDFLWARNAPADGAGPRALDFHTPVGDLVATRSGWGAGDYLLSIKSGFTNRNHSHLDAGALSLAFGDEWLLIAPGYGLGAGDGAFWQSNGTRWNYFSNGTESHATLLINGRNQRFDREARGTVTRFFTAPDWSFTALDLGQAYQDVTAVTREVLHRRGDYILVFDHVETPQPATVEWLAQFRKIPETEADGGLRAEGKNGRLRVRILAPADAALTSRAPTLPKVDVKPDRHFTYAAKQTGARVDFISLLQPVAGAKSTPPLKTRGSDRQLAISGEGWTDLLVRAETDAPQKLAFEDRDIGATARLAIVSIAADSSVQSAFVLDATELHLPELTFRSAAPCDLTAQRSTDGTWLVTAARDIRGDLSGPVGKTPRFELSQPLKPTVDADR